MTVQVLHEDTHDHPKPRVILIPLDATETTPKGLNWAKDTLLNKDTDLVVLFSAYKSAAHDLPIGMGVDYEGSS